MVLVLVEHDRESVGELSMETLTVGRRLADRLDVPLRAVMVGAGALLAAGRLRSYGVSAVHVAEHARLEDYAPDAWARSVVQLMEEVSARVVLAAGSERGNEVMARVAARTDLPMAANCTAVEPGEPGDPGDPFMVTRQRWGGTLLEDARLDASVKLLTVAPHVVRPEEAPGDGEVTVTTFPPDLSDEDFRVRVTERVEKPAEGVSLAEARVVVGGGRGVGGAEGFSALEELADLLGGTVGCSRAVTSAGWRPHADQVGQTGVRIAPDLYVACGISGATQHIVGCKGAKRILAINTDADAPMMAQADYAVVGDLREIVPALSAAIRYARQAGAVTS
jgi:electron transfer flavoprotein alpha subunit